MNKEEKLKEISVKLDSLTKLYEPYNSINSSNISVRIKREIEHLHLWLTFCKDQYELSNNVIQVWSEETKSMQDVATPNKELTHANFMDWRLSNFI